MNRALGGAVVIIIGLLLLGAGIIIFRTVDREVPQSGDWTIVVRAPMGNVTVLDMDDIREQGKGTVVMVLLGTGEDGRPHSYNGLLVRDLAARLAISVYGSVTVKAADSYSKKLTRSQVEDNDIILVHMKDGKPLKTRADGGPGPVRLLLPQSAVGPYNAQHCVKWVSEVVFE